jgi:hypothetical protein
MKNKTIKIPGSLWVDLVNIFYLAIQHIERTDKNSTAIDFLKKILEDSFNAGEILIIDGKIIDKEDVR